MTHRPARSRGLTLLETMIALAIVGLLASLAAPGFGALVERHRLRHAAETLAADLTQARFEAARRGAALYLDARAGRDWCWAVATEPGCGCERDRACQLKSERGSDHGNVRLVEAAPATLLASGEVQAPPAPALLESGHGERLQVQLSPLGRASICSPDGAVAAYPAC